MLNTVDEYIGTSSINQTHFKEEIMFLMRRFFAEKKTKDVGVATFGFGNGMCGAAFLLVLASPADPLLLGPAVLLGFGGALTATAGGATVMMHKVAHH